MTHSNRRRATALLAAASSLALSSPAWAADVLFSTNRDSGVEVDQRVEQASGLTQVRLDSGAVVSFLDNAAYRINADGSVELFSGSVTVAGAPADTTVIRMPEGVEGRVGGTGSAASFSVAADGSSNGHVMSGLVQIFRNGSPRDFAGGEMWQWARQGGLRLVVANGAQATPGANIELADMSEGGPAAAAENGVPVTLGDALAAAGASGDVIAAARRVEAAAGNPDLASFPSGDLALLVGYAAQLEGLYGGRPFPGAGADIIRTYLGHLVAGGGEANFLAAYAGFMAQYLDLLRTGALPSGFQAASLTDINSFIAYLGRTSGFGSLSPANRTLVEAYIAFLQGGGNPDLFTGNYTNLVNAYLAYLRTGGEPAAFTGATQATLNAYIAFLSDSGLLAQLSAANRALVQAYLANGGFAFAAQYRTALDAYFAYLAAGNLPSGYGAIDAATLRAYLETLQASGLFEQVLGARVEFYAGYLAYLQAGGTLDGYAGLNANVFAGYASQLNAFFAFIQGGGLPQGYDGDVEALFAYLAALEEAGALEAYLGDSAGFYAQYLAFVQGGGDVNLFAQLPGLNLDSFAAALNTYALFIQGGGLPSGYSEADLDLLATYIAILRNSGRLAELLGANASILNGYFTYLAGGGSADGFSGLPLYSGYVTALNAYYAFLASGGLPEDYTGLTQAQIQAYLAALQSAGGLAAYGSLEGFFAGYYAFLAEGGDPANYGGIPVYADYLAALQAYYDFLAAGGLPSAYTQLTQEQIRMFLLVLRDAGVLAASLTAAELDFVLDYLAFVQGGGDPDQFAELPANGSTATLASGARVWNFSAEGGRIAIAPTAQVAADGTIEKYTFETSPGSTFTLDYAGNDSNQAKERGRIGGDVAWTRYRQGVNSVNLVNANVHLLLGVPATNLPASGKVDYRLVGGTAPTDYYSAPGSEGSFSGQLAVAFGPTPQVGLSFDVYSGTRGWHAQTGGGAADPTNGGLLVDSNMAFASLDLPHTGIAGDACSGYCNIQVFGGLFGAGAANAGFQYHIDDQSGGSANRDYINGVAVFGTTGTALTQIGTRPGSGTDIPTLLTGYTGGFNPSTANVNFVVGGKLNGNNFAGGESGFQTQGFSLDSSGGLTSYTRTGGTTRTNGSASATDIYGDADVLIGRWASGTNSGANVFTMNANQGFHYMLARPLAAVLPTSGQIDYYLVAATRPTITDGSYAPGTFAAQMAILFGSQNRLAMEGTITMPTGGADYVFSFATVGGIANSDQTTTPINVNDKGFFSGFIEGATDNAGNCATDCGLGFFASFAKDQDAVGMTYQGYVPVAGKSLVGAAIFEAGRARTGAAPAALAGEWVRFDETLDGARAAPSGMPATPAKAEVEARLGGMITFGGAGAP
jgi:hypothetical protein